ncbi:DUF1015 domain-containing protein [Tenuifilum sp.]|uniref:DUF1015 domain-containing protein n=1 Tax=Tenuifilum sp. TaxID=2760880 RepID=UPI001B59A26F|nr:DUF1015 domain-containing protein [Bacteroidales bacterium]MBP9030324.1 DUF1015 domain-containing protein [Bacteroidales bacterium]HQE54748.1 DUF1015 family protein [Tenuifilum sp.]HQG72798.1 DUF1015 family protein [Tenuifilum sp.]HQI88671.1 DUF1015 family protein [Tenuifilum sp.]
MVKIKAFKGIRPPREIAKEVAARPYDVLNSQEAKAEAGEKSLLHITKPEIDFDPIIDEHTQQAYDKAVENFRKWKERGWLVQDPKDMYYVYAQTMDGRTQYGLVVACHFEDYMEGRIKKHELTRPDKEEDRMIHIRIQNANIEPVFFAYPAHKEMDEIVTNVVTSKKPEYDFVADDGFGHHFWVIDDEATIKRITEIFASIPALYVADGHHRTAAAARVGLEKKNANPNHRGDEEYNYFLAVIFPDNQLKIIDYNRVVKDLNGLTPEQFLQKLNEGFVVEEKGSEIYKPQQLHNFSMYLEGKWYSLTAKPGTYNDNDPIGVLDVTILSNLVLDPILDIKDLRTSKRIDFVGGIRGLGELKKRVDSGEMKVAFALYPVSMKQLIDIADTGNIMPPKTTWFEPKLRSGLVIHALE